MKTFATKWRGNSIGPIRFIIIVLSAMFVMSCATVPTTALPPQKIIVEVVSATDQKVEVKESQVNRSMEVHNPEGRLSSLTFVSGDKAFIKIFSGLSIADVTRLWNDFCILEHNTTIRDVNLFINSPGGDAFSGLALADQIERARRKGFKVTAHASGIIASAAVPVFAVCSLRLAAPGTIFMLHEAALWKWPGRESASDIRSQNDLMVLLEDRYISYLIKYTKLPKDEWKEKEKNTTWFSAEKAFDWGLVDAIE